MNLYRLMTNVSAGAGHECVRQGAFGIVTLWLRAASVQIAIEQAERLLLKRGYESIGRLTTYLEEPATNGLPIAAEPWPEDPTVTGYRTIKQRAIQQADGLLEAWLSDGDERLNHVYRDKVAA